MKTFSAYLTEATLAGKSTNGTPNVQKYVTDNPKALEIDYEIEKNKKDGKKTSHYISSAQPTVGSSPLSTLLKEITFT